MEKFIKENKIFWSGLEFIVSDKKLLVEEPSIPMINHANALLTIVLNQAKHFTPCYLGVPDVAFIKSYVPSASIVEEVKLSIFKKVLLRLTTFYKYIVLLVKKDILSVSYDGVRYGDIIYDTYLSKYKLATIKKIEPRFMQIIYKCIYRHEHIKKTIQKHGYSAVLVSHQIGIHSGVLLRAALKCGCAGYLRVGHHLCTFKKFYSLDEIYDYQFKPTKETIDLICEHLGESFNEKFEGVCEQHFGGKFTKDSVFAFGEKAFFYKTKQEFCQKHNLSNDKKNVFIMLHAFIDHPHSHFKWMLFKDYYDWFIKTLDYAKSNKNVNWIFKQHPAIKYYATKDVDFSELFSETSENIIYLDEEEKINIESLKNCADLIVTCIGSAGFELPALGRIPSLVAGDNPYLGLGFAHEPVTQREYFKILDDINNIKKITKDQQKRAQATFMYNYYFSRGPNSICPQGSFDDENDSNQASWYWDKVLDTYKGNNTIFLQLEDLVKQVEKDSFKQYVRRDM